MNRWNPGDQIVVREIFNGRIWSGRPMTVIADSDELLALYKAVGTRYVLPKSISGERINALPGTRWRLVETEWTGRSIVRIVEAGLRASVLVFYDAFGAIAIWYINLEIPFRRTPIGFDYLDQVLDIVVKGDRSSWRWKDEDEVDAALASGLMDQGWVNVLRAEGERLAERILRADPPYDDRWRSWRPDPVWPIPLLPEGWDLI